MHDLLLISGATLIICYLIFLSRTTKNSERSVRLSNAFVALACFLICFSYLNLANDIRLPWGQIKLSALCYDFGLVSFFAALYIMFIQLLKDPVYKYSPYVIIIGMSLLTMYTSLAVPIG